MGHWCKRILRRSLSRTAGSFNMDGLSSHERGVSMIRRDLMADECPRATFETASDWGLGSSIQSSFSFQSAVSSESGSWNRGLCFLLSTIVHLSTVGFRATSIVIFAFPCNNAIQLCALQGTASLIGIVLSMFVAREDADVRWMLRTSPVMRCLGWFLCVFLGVTQLIHVKRAWARQIRVAEVFATMDEDNFLWTGPGLGAERVLPIAFFTGVPTALINCYAVVRLQVSQGSEILLACTASSAMFIVAVVAVIVDASMSTHVATRCSNIEFGGCYPLLHTLYRLSEVVSRCFMFTSTIILIKYVSGINGSVVALTVFGLDYFLVVMILKRLSPEDIRIHMMVSVGLLLVNSMRFVDSPGFALPARRVSVCLNSLRVFQTLCWMIGSCCVFVRLLPVLQKDPEHDLRRIHPRAFAWVICFFISVVAAVVHYCLNVCGLSQGDDLHSAVLRGDVEKVRQLVKITDGWALDVNGRIRDPTEVTPLMLAAISGHVELLELLVAAGGQVHLTDARGETSIHHAIRHVRVDALRFLVAQKHASRVLLGDKDALFNLVERIAVPERDVMRDLLVPGVATEARVKPILRSINATFCKSGLGSLFPQVAVDEEPHVDLSSVSGLLFANTLGPLAKYARRLAPRVPDSRNSSMPLESMRYIRDLGQGAAGRVIEVEVLGDRSRRPISWSYTTSSLSGSTRYAMKLQLKMRHRAEWEACSELVALRRAAHPFIVRLEHAFQTPKFFALLLELCAGGSLNNLVTSKCDCTGQCLGLSVERTARYMGQTLLALVHLHQKLGVVYRDMKLDNVLLYNDMTAKLADFGLAKRVGTRQRHMRVEGTMGFLAPELLSHDNDDCMNPFKTDAYSFAVTFELTLLGEDVGVVHGDEGRWLTPRSGDEAVKLLRIENAVKNRGLPAAAFHLLRELLVDDPSQRSELSSPTVLRHPFFLDALGCSDLESFLLNDSARRHLPSQVSSDSV